MNTACAHAQDIIQRGLDGDPLSAAEQSALDAHLASCAACAHTARDLGLMAQLLERLPAPPAPAGLAARLAQIPALEAKTATGWAARLGRAWAPLAGLAGVGLLAYQAWAATSLSLADMPAALAEWAGMIDLNHLESLAQATALLGASIGGELLAAFSLITIAVFGMMLQAIARPPAIGTTLQRPT